MELPKESFHPIEAKIMNLLHTFFGHINHILDSFAIQLCTVQYTVPYTVCSLLYTVHVQYSVYICKRLSCLTYKIVIKFI